MNDIIIQNDQTEWLDMKQAAALLQITPTAIRMLVRKYSDRLLPYLHSEVSRGRTGKKTFISKQGLVVLGNVRNDNGKRKESFSLAKQQLAERAIETTQPQSMAQVLLQSAQILVEHENQIAQLRQETSQTQVRVDELENKVTQMQLSFEGEKYLTGPQRATINDRVRALAIRRFAQDPRGYALVYTELHNYLGRANITEYLFEDYPRVVEWLKAKYVEYSLSW